MTRVVTQARYVLRLYVAGAAPKSQRAIAHIKALCEGDLKGRYELKVIDIYQQPGQLSEARVIAAPMLLKALPLPLRRLVGDLSDAQRVSVALDLQAGAGRRAS